MRAAQKVTEQDGWIGCRAENAMRGVKKVIEQVHSVGDIAEDVLGGRGFGGISGRRSKQSREQVHPVGGSGLTG